MRALVQRVSRAEVAVGDEIVGRCGAGLLILVCAMRGDTQAQAERLAARISKLRIFRDAEGRMNRALADLVSEGQGGALVVSQFTLAADTSRGNRPGFSNAAAPQDGERLYLHFAKALAALGIPVETGRFGADMAVSLTNDGPVTIWIEA